MSNTFSIDSVPTPALVVDLPTVRRNIRQMADFCRGAGLRLRPHTKTHKSVMMARLQMEAGAGGLTVAKAGEAEVMAAAADDLFVAYPALDPPRCQRLAALGRERTIRAGVDSMLAIDRLAEAARRMDVTIGILVDLDVGFHRTGVSSPQRATELAQHVARTSGVRLDGIMCFPGHVREPNAEQAPVLARVAEIIQAALDMWARHGLSASIVSGGSSPSAMQSNQIRQLTEIRPGTYIYNDMNQVAGGRCGFDDVAAKFVCTVVSDAVEGKVVIDAGSKTLTTDRIFNAPDTGGFGHVVEYPEARVIRLSEEHGEVDLSRCSERPKLGERVSVIPNHICPAVNLHDAAWLRDGTEELSCLPIDARGRVT